MRDELALEIDAITKAAQDQSITIVLGSFDNEKLPLVEWETSTPSALQIYLGLAKNLGCSFVVLEKFQFDEEVMEELRAGQSEAGDGMEPDDGEEGEASIQFEAKWEKLTHEYTTHYGSLYSFALHYVGGGICHTYEKESSWYKKLIEAADVLREEFELAEAATGEEEIPELTDKEIEALGAKLANNDLFQKATNQNARRFALSRSLPEVAAEHPHQVSDIIDHAKGVFELLIKPELEKALDKQISELSQQGLSKDQIAKKLKVPLSRVNKGL
jgi:hypothetical protein